MCVGGETPGKQEMFVGGLDTSDSKHRLVHQIKTVFWAIAHPSRKRELVAKCKYEF
jgi:hypothetical protein